MGRLVLLSMMLVGGATLRAQEPPARNGGAQGPVFRSGAEIVALSVAVMDPAQNFVRGLSLDDFAVYEDGVRQDVSFFAAAEVPLDLILLLDSSASMTGKMDTVHEAALGFLRTLRPTDRGAVVSFSDGVRVLEPLTADNARLERAVRATQARGATALHNAIYVALKEFGRAAKSTEEVRRQAIAVLSDGEDTSSLISFEDVLLQAKKSGVGIYTISLRAEPAQGAQRGNFSTALYSMRTLAQETGAQSFFPAGIRELSGVYAKIANELEHQYAIGYSPKNPRADGRFRRVVVQVVSRPELRLRTRTGYFADRPSPAALPSIADVTARAARPMP